mgnify:CR=1 FL=1
MNTRILLPRLGLAALCATAARTPTSVSLLVTNAVCCSGGSSIACRNSSWTRGQWRGSIGDGTILRV